MGKMVQAGQTMDPKAPKVPVATLVVTPEQAKILELAKNEGRISLSLRNPLDAPGGRRHYAHQHRRARSPGQHARR